MNAQSVPVGVVGLGLMGTSIVTCLAAAGHPVVGIDKDAGRRRALKRRVSVLLRDSGVTSARFGIAVWSLNRFSKISPRSARCCGTSRMQLHPTR